MARNLNDHNNVISMVLSLKIKEVKKSFDKKVVLKNISLDVKECEIVGLIGKSGCGKSTLLKILVGYYKADAGKIILNDENVARKNIELRRVVGYTTQENSFYEKLSVEENMKYYAHLYKIPKTEETERINYLLTAVGLIDSRKVLAENISGGMKRRLDFAISLVHNPNVLILDEPTTGLDPLLIDQFWNIVKDVVAKEKKIAIMSSHILPEIEKYCTKAAVMDGGELVKVLSKNQMKNLENKFRSIVDKKTRQ